MKNVYYTVVIKFESTGRLVVTKKNKLTTMLITMYLAQLNKQEIKTLIGAMTTAMQSPE